MKTYLLGHPRVRVLIWLSPWIACVLAPLASMVYFGWMASARPDSYGGVAIIWAAFSGFCIAIGWIIGGILSGFAQEWLQAKLGLTN